MKMNPTENRSKEVVAEFLLEDSALKRLKLREQVYYPNLSPFRHKGAWGKMIGGCSLCASAAFTEIPTWELPVLGLIMILIGIFEWHKEETKAMHQRIDKLLELQSVEMSDTLHVLQNK